MFIDFKAAYEAVKINKLWQIMVKHGFPTKIIRLIRATLDASKSNVGVADEVLMFFLISIGLK